MYGEIIERNKIHLKFYSVNLIHSSAIFYISIQLERNCRTSLAVIQKKFPSNSSQPHRFISELRRYYKQSLQNFLNIYSAERSLAWLTLIFQL